MKLFAMLMLRCALVMILSSFIQNGTLATLGESSKSCQEEINEYFKAVGENPFDINHHLDFLKKVNAFPFEGMEMEELLKRQLPKPVKIVIGNCKKLEKEHKKVVEHIRKHKWTSGNTKEIKNLFQDLCKLSENKVQFCDTNSFTKAWVWTQGDEKTKTPQNQKELGEQLHALKNKLSEKIAGFAQQKKQIDVDGFRGFSAEFINKWNEIKRNIDKLTKKDDKDTLRKKLDELAEIAMKETAPLKAIITKKLAEKDKEMISKAYQVKDKKKSRRIEIEK